MDTPKIWRMLWFRKTMLFFFITVCIPTAAISAVYMYTFSQELQSRYTTSLSAETDRLVDQIDTLMQPIERLSWQLSYTSNLDPILQRTDRTSMYDYMKLQTALKDQTSIGGIVHSIYIHFGVSGRVLTSHEGLYADNEFFDREILNPNQTAGPYIVRNLAFDQFGSPTTGGTPVITFTQELPLAGTVKLGRIIVNISLEKFENTLQRMNNALSKKFYLADMRTGRVISPGKQENPNQGTQLIDGWKRDPGGAVKVSLENVDYFASYRILFDSWLLVNLSPTVHYQSEMAAKWRSLLLTDLIILLLGLGFSYLFSFIVYSPWRSILKQYGSFFKPGAPRKIYDEYALFGDGVNRLLEENQHIACTIEQMTPLFRHKLVYDLLNGYAQSNPGLAHLLDTHGIAFKQERFIVAMVSWAPSDTTSEQNSESLMLLVYSLVETGFSHQVDTAGTWVDEGRLAYILNAPGGIEETEWIRDLEEICRRTNEILEERMGISLRFAFSRPVDDIAHVPDSYLAARRLLNYRALYNRTEVMFVEELNAGRDRPAFPLSLQHLLVRKVLIGDKGGAEEALEMFFTQYLDAGKFSPEKIQDAIMVLAGVLMNELLKEGYDLEEWQDLHFLQWSECRDKQDLKQFLRMQIGRLSERMKIQEPPKTENEYVAKAVAYIEQHYMENIAIADLADAVGLTPNYISRLFKQEIGTPPLDYLTRYRIQKAKEMMLLPNRLSLKEISQRVGYPDVHSFIRFFKKYETVTPGAFRKLGLDKQ